MQTYLSKISLSSWDEAWYGVIAKNIYNTGDFLNLLYNGNPFFDHPPFVMWMMEVSFKIFGVSEFAVRLPSAILGIGTVFILYLLSRELFGKLTGLFAGLGLLTSPWFLTRTLSGNLDIPLTFLFVLTFYLAVKVSKNTKYIIPLSISLSFLFLTKSLVPFTILPAVLLILWKKVPIKYIFFMFLVFIFLTLPWFIYTLSKNPMFLQRYFAIGFPGASVGTNIIENMLLTKTYLHNGIGNWFYPGFASIFLGMIFYRKKYMTIFIFAAAFLFPFALSNKGHIWHLIPLHPFWIMSFFGFLHLANNNFSKTVRFLIMLVLFLLISWGQMKRNWYEIIKAPAYTSDIEILSTKSKDYDLPLYLDDDAVPEALFYSDKKRVERIMSRGTLRKLFDSNERFMVITRDWRLEEENISVFEYELILKDRDKVLILKK